MLQLTQQDLMSIQQLTSTILPKIINRLKECENTNKFLSGRIDELALVVQEVQAKQAAVVESVPVKKPSTRGRKKKVVEPEPVAPIEQTEQLVPAEGVTVSADPLSRSTAVVASVESPVNGEIGAGIAAVTPSAADEHQPSMADGPGVIDANLVRAVQYITTQGYNDTTAIAEALALPEALIQRVLDMPISEQARFLEES